MGLLCCLGSPTIKGKAGSYSSPGGTKALVDSELLQPAGVGSAKTAVPIAGHGASLLKDDQQRRAEEPPPQWLSSGGSPTSRTHHQQQHLEAEKQQQQQAAVGDSSGREALMQLLAVLTSLEGGWWDQVERALAATAQHLLAAHACIFLISSDLSYATPLALAGPPAPPLCIGTPLPLLGGPNPAAPRPGSGAAPSVLTSSTYATQCNTSSSSSVAAAAAVSAGGGGGPMREAAGLAGAAAASAAGSLSCAAAALLAEQLGKEAAGRMLLFADAGSGELPVTATADRKRSSGGRAAAGGGGGGRGSGLPPSAPPEWRFLAEAEAATAGSGDGDGGGGGRRCCRHFAAVSVPAGAQPLGVLSLGAEGPCRPPCWTPEALHCTAAMLSAPLKHPQVDLVCRTLAELSYATTVHQLVRTLLGAASELVASVTRIETQTRVAFLQADVEAAAVFQSAATDALGPAVRRRLSEVLLVDTSAMSTAAAAASTAASSQPCGGGGAGLIGALGRLLLGGGGDGRTSTGGPAAGAPGAGTAVRRSLGGTEVVASRTPSVSAIADAHRDSFARIAHAAAEELPVCRGHSLPLKHTLLSEALARGAGLCIADCNAYVQDSKVYPRDLAVSRGSAPAQSLALATSCHGGVPLLALYGTHPSVLPQPLLQSVVQELGQLLRALTPSVAAKVEGDLAVEWGYLRHQLMESMRNRSLRNLNAGFAATSPSILPQSQQPPPPPLQPPHNQNGTGARSEATPTSAAAADSPVGGDSVPYDSATQLRSVAVSVGCLQPLTPGGADGGCGGIASDSAGLDRPRVGTGGCGGGRDGRTSRRASFSLEAANSPRGSSKLAPLMATLHDRLRAVQAEQIANSRAASRMQDMESIRILEQIGRGGYGVVYRGMYHGSEVAIKVIQEAGVAVPDAADDNGGGGDPLQRLNSVALENKHLHDAIELVASVGMGGHPNIVQVLTFFTDVQVVVGDEPVGPLNRRLSGLDGVAELIRLTRMPTATSGLTVGAEDSPPPQQPSPSPRGRVGQPGQGQLAAQQQAPGLPGPREGGVIVLVQEFCDAGTLKNAINERAFYHNVAPTGSEMDRPSHGHLQLNLKAVYSTLLEIALALRHMHGLHLVHCDLKPQNVLLKSSPRDPRGFTVKLSDFGLAKMMAADETGRLVIDEAVGSGTLTHMAPESLAGQRQLNASIDMFAYGILMWQMVCGTRLYQGLTSRQIIRGVVREGLRPAFPAWVPTDYRRLAARCWHASPSERPTATAVVAELEAMVDAHTRAASAAAVIAWRPLPNPALATPAAAIASPHPLMRPDASTGGPAAAAAAEPLPASPRPPAQPHPNGQGHGYPTPPTLPPHFQHLQQLQQMQQQLQQQMQQLQQQHQKNLYAAAAAAAPHGPRAWPHPHLRPQQAQLQPPLQHPQHPQLQPPLQPALQHPQPLQQGGGGAHRAGMGPVPAAAPGMGPGGRLII